MTEDAGRTIVFLTETLGTKEGGKSEGMFKAAKMLRDGGHRVVIANHVFGKNQRKKYHELQSRVGADDIAFENLYNWLAGEETTDELEKEPKVRNQNKNKHLTYTKEYHKAGSSTCCRREYYDIDDEQIAMSLHRPSSGEAYMTATSWDDNNPATGIEDLICGRHFNKLNDLLSRFLTYLDGKYHSPVFITDHILWDRVLCRNHDLTHDPKTIALFNIGVVDNKGAVRRRSEYLADKGESLDKMMFLSDDDAEIFKTHSNIDFEGVRMPESISDWNRLIESMSRDGEAGNIVLHEPDMAEHDTKSIIMITDTFSISSGGRTASIFRRAGLYREMGYDVYIATKNFRIHYADIFNVLCEKYGLEGVKLLNPYTFFAEEDIYALHSEEAAEMTNGDVEESDPGHIITKDIDGNIVREQYFDHDNRELIAESYFTPTEHRLYLERKEGSPEYRWIRRDGSVLTFYNIRKAQEYWIAGICRDLSDPIIIAEQHEGLDMLINNPFVEGRSKCIALIHSTIFDSPYSYSSPLESYYDRPLKRLDEYARAVALTSQERDHISNIYGRDHKVIQIPHPIEQIEIEEVKRDTDLIVLCTRLDQVKRVDHSIEAMAKVIEECPDARLHIYGDGPERENLEKLIVDKGLGSSVELKGFTQEPVKRISEALFTVSTSNYEGLPLQIQEALMVGTPVIAYDYMYGPRELIKDGENGFIVKKDDIDALADRMIWMLQNTDRVEEMSRAARIRKEGHKNEHIKTAWESIFSDANQRQKSGVILPPGSVKIKKITRKIKGDMVHFTAQFDICFSHRVAEPVHFVLNYNNENGIQISDRLFLRGEAKWKNDQRAVVRFEKEYPKDDFKILFPEESRMKLLIETDFNSYTYLMQ